MLSLHLQGGFGEKGRTSLGVDDGRTRIVLDAGIKVGAAGDEYYPLPLLPPDRVDALLISHAHEDHVGALCRLLARGYRGPVFMTAQTRAEMFATLAQYADADELRRFPPPDGSIELFDPGDTLAIGSLSVATGASGHVAGGVWFAVSAGESRVVYAADMVPASRVFDMAMPPACDVLALDASYGTDPVTAATRAAEIAAWVASHAGGCLMPTPLSGRSLELMAVLDRPFAIAEGMRAPLAAQIEPGVLRPGMAELLRARLATAIDWQVGAPFPAMPLLVHDGMGVAGPARPALEAAVAAGLPILLSGHLPAGSPGARLAAQGRADWIRMPTHPTLDENVALWQALGRPMALGHSCDAETLAELGRFIPALQTGARTGHTIEIGKEDRRAHSHRQ